MPTNPKKFFEHTATGRYYKVYKDGEYVSQHYNEREAIEKAQEVKFEFWDSEVKYNHEYEVNVGLTDAGITEAQDYGTPADTPPVIISTPSVQFLAENQQVQTYDMSQHWTDDGISTVTSELTTILPNGLSYNGNTHTLTYDGVEPATTSQHTLRVTDAVDTVESAQFDIVVLDEAPVISTVGTISFSQGTQSSHELSQYVTDDGASALTYSMTPTPSVANGLSLNPTTGRLSYDGTDITSGDSYTFTVADSFNQDTSNSFTVNVTVQDSAWEWNVPLLADETNFYTNVMGWSIPGDAATFAPGLEESYPWQPATSYSFGDIHYDTEGDNLWAWNQQYKRYGIVSVGSGDTTQDWNNDLATYFAANLVSTLQTSSKSGGAPDEIQFGGWGYDHLYGQGLASIYNDGGSDPSVKTAIDGLRGLLEGNSQVQNLINSTPIAMSYFLARGTARWGIVAAYCYQATGETEWQTLRDALQFGFETSTDWEEGGNIQNGGGCFFASSEQAGYDSITGYAGGRRYNWGPGLGLAAEAMYRIYIQTGSSILRDRLIKMAKYVQYYAHDPSWDYPNAGDRWGHEGNGDRYHQSGGNGTAITAAADCSYDSALINIMVFGYKLTGDASMLSFAHKLFERGTRFDPNNVAEGVYGLWTAGNDPDAVYKYIDTQTNSSAGAEFQWNKGQLQYCYQVFENGGYPVTETAGPIETLANSMMSGEWAELTTTTGLNTLRNSYNSLYNNSSFMEYNCNAIVYKKTGDVHFTGSSDLGRPSWHLKYTESTGAWTQVEDLGSHGHTYDGFSIDQSTGDFYQLYGPQLWKGNQNGNWAFLTDRTGTGFGEVVDGGEWFPDANSGAGGYVVCGAKGSGKVYLWDGASWSMLSGTLGLNDNNYHNGCIYLPKQKVMMVGGGDNSTAFWELDSSYNLTQKADVQDHWGPGFEGSHGSITAFENGRVFHVSLSDLTLHEYTYGNPGSWSSLGSLPAGMGDWWQVSCSIDHLGVILVLAQSPNSASSITQWLYKL